MSIETMEAGHVREEGTADLASQLVIKLEPPWHADEDLQGPPSAIYSTVQPNASLLSQNQKHPCYLCPATFVLISSFELHLASVHGEKLHVVLPGSSTPPDRCDDGDYTDVDKGMDGHINRKTIDKGMDGHINRKTIKQTDDNSGDKDRSNWKNFAFPTPSELKSNKLTHSDHKPFVCDVCSKHFAQAVSLKKHKRVHKGVRPFKCPHCDSDFKESSHLQHHIKSVHDESKPHICDVCGAAFSLNGDLKVHRRVHTGEKPFVCSDCGKAFINSSNLKKHRLTHTGEKPHVCSECGKGFAQSSHLANHRLTHSGVKPYSCPHCPSTFRYLQDLKKHIQKKHQ